MPRKGTVIVQHRVKDFEYWKPFFTGDSKRQKKAGFTSWRLMKDIKDPNNIIIVFECNDLEKAKAVYSDPEVAKIIKKAGVVGEAAFFLAEDSESKKL